ncbi:hypothetical protein EYF80_066775 [Liparis tanakae]|uniref:Uncharacterized protein n=1 Tax=Liparis tanakae TaxID=230148 RepID=A0A4Z2E2X2_9TELE|nr:hypothetical protein EYF80_066775 [Liparis tanakae]
MSDGSDGSSSDLGSGQHGKQKGSAFRISLLEYTSPPPSKYTSPETIRERMATFGSVDDVWGGGWKTIPE